MQDLEKVSIRYMKREVINFVSVYWEAMEQYDEAVTNQNKERSEQAEQATASAQTKRNDCRMKMMDFIGKSINDQRGKHAEAVLK